MQEYCPYSRYIDKGIEKYLLCSLTGRYCLYQKYCNTKQMVVHTDKWHECVNKERKEKN
jgi:hypothetical protein